MPKTSLGGYPKSGEGERMFIKNGGGGVKNFDQVWGGEKKVSPRFGGKQQTFKKGLKWGGQG